MTEHSRPPPPIPNPLYCGPQQQQQPMAINDYFAIPIHYNNTPVDVPTSSYTPPTSSQYVYPPAPQSQSQSPEEVRVYRVWPDPPDLTGDYSLTSSDKSSIANSSFSSTHSSVTPSYEFTNPFFSPSHIVETTLSSENIFIEVGDGLISPTNKEFSLSIKNNTSYLPLSSPPMNYSIDKIKSDDEVTIDQTYQSYSETSSPLYEQASPELLSQRGSISQEEQQPLQLQLPSHQQPIQLQPPPHQHQHQQQIQLHLPPHLQHQQQQPPQQQSPPPPPPQQPQQPQQQSPPPRQLPPPTFNELLLNESFTRQRTSFNAAAIALQVEGSISPTEKIFNLPPPPPPQQHSFTSSSSSTTSPVENFFNLPSPSTPSTPPEKEDLLINSPKIKKVGRPKGSKTNPKNRRASTSSISSSSTTQQTPSDILIVKTKSSSSIKKHRSSLPGPIPATVPTFVKKDENGTDWISFQYSRKRVRSTYCIRCDVESVELSQLPQQFKIDNCIYPRAAVPPEQYKGNRQKYESECNCIGWCLAFLNPELAYRRGLIQRAVDSWRNTNSDTTLRSRRVRKMLRSDILINDEE